MTWQTDKQFTDRQSDKQTDKEMYRETRDIHTVHVYYYLHLLITSIAPDDCQTIQFDQNIHVCFQQIIVQLIPGSSLTVWIHGEMTCEAMM